ncbi:OpgC family protein [Oceanibaculum pacificum]|uniref:OpgC protein n=1 Tax=Oceanibaculum pacificum TaxID=580166 RepID=A0A154W648_9PROT|nr:OpgC domain-containing protein [Oceanibaculum pacificum]KZD09016.1 hypothetical protein AUP43_07900 [Oceanibaculum pacificum]
MTSAGSERATQPASQRDYRLDFFRGVALLFIFLNHIPGNDFSWITNKHFGISDATEIFVFVSGYSAAIAYSRRMASDGFRAGAMRMIRRAGTIYLAHIATFLILAVLTLWVSRKYQDIDSLVNTNLLTLLVDPPMALIEALLLGYRPMNMDVLPMYVLLMLCFPWGLWGLMHYPRTTIALSGAIWLAAGQFGINLMRYPTGDWYFNPLAWQFLFMLGAFMRLYPQDMPRPEKFDRALQPLAILYLLFGLYLASTFYWPGLLPALPPVLHDLIHPIDKTDLDVLRVLHFLAAAYLASRWIEPAAGWLTSRWARPITVTGQQSLPIFCFGILLAFSGRWILRTYDASLTTQFVISVGGIAFMMIAADMLSHYAAYRRARPKPAGLGKALATS